jgi:hypothetical protein
LFGDKVYLTREEHESLKEKFWEYKTNKYITNLDLYIQSTGKVYKSHYATIRMWFNRDWIREIEKKEAPPPVEKAEISEEERAKNREIVQKMRKTFLTPKQVE